MDKIILNDGTTLEFIGSIGIGSISIKNKTFEELETLLTIENLSKIQIVNIGNEVYANYINLKCVSITKYIADESVSISLKETIAQ